MRRCGSGRAAGLAQNLRGAERRCDSARVFCEAGVDRAFTATADLADGGGEWGWKGRMEGATGRDGRED